LVLSVRLYLSIKKGGPAAGLSSKISIHHSQWESDVSLSLYFYFYFYFYFYLLMYIEVDYTKDHWQREKWMSIFGGREWRGCAID
jgi:hypothetical protein